MKTLIFVCALVYLSVELALNAAILDLVAPGVDYLSVQKVQDISGALGGIGIGLLLVRLFVHRLPDGDAATPRNLMISGLAVVFSATLHDTGG